MEITISNEAFIEPGYVFITPYQQPQAGPYIFDKKGVSLVLTKRFNRAWTKAMTEPRMERLGRHWSFQCTQFLPLRLLRRATPVLVSRKPALWLRSWSRNHIEPGLQDRQDNRGRW